MKRRPPNPNPNSYWPTFRRKAKGGYEYQRSGQFKFTQGFIIFCYIGLLEPYLIHHNNLNSPAAFFVLLLSMIACMQIADYILYRLAKHRK